MSSPRIFDRAAFNDFYRENCQRAGGCWYDNSCPILDAIQKNGTHTDIRQGKRRIVCTRFLSNKQGRDRAKKQEAEAQRQQLIDMHYGGGLF